MLNRNVLIITDEMTDDEIYEAIQRNGTPLIWDGRSCINEMINDIVRVRYAEEQRVKAKLAKANNLERVSTEECRPAPIEI